MSLSKSDKIYIESLIDSKIDKLKQETEEAMEKFRSSFYDRVDPILKEVLANREERVIIISRLEKLEGKD